MSLRIAAHLLTAVAASGVMSGCVAVALPIMAGGMIAKKQVGAHRPKANSAKPARVAKAARPKAGRATVTARMRQARARRPGVVATGPTPAQVAVSVPMAVPARIDPGSYGTFSGYAFERSRPGAAGEVRYSVIYDPVSTLSRPRMRECGNLGPAVLIDLDPGTARFDPAASGKAEVGVVEALESLRRGGVTILWASDLAVDQAEAVYAKLRSTGLDPAGTDRLLLAARPGEPKQARRQAAAKSYCIVAMAGDRRGDFDELYDYLRDPAAAVALEPNISAGWFLTPLPIH